MYIFNGFYLLHSYNPSFLICLCFNMVSFRGQKKLGPQPDRSPLGVSFKISDEHPHLFHMWSPPPPGTCNAWENSRHSTMPPVVSPRYDVWEASAEIPYWWHVTTQIWVVLLISDWSCRVENLIQPIRSTTQISVVTRHQHQHLRSFLRRHLAGKSVVASPNVCCFLRINLRSRKLAFYRGRISLVGRAPDCREQKVIGFDSQGRINTSILGVLKELRNEGTSNALQTVGRIMVVPSPTKSRKKK